MESLKALMLLSCDYVTLYKYIHYYREYYTLYDLYILFTPRNDVCGHPKNIPVHTKNNLSHLFYHTRAKKWISTILKRGGFAKKYSSKTYRQE